MIPSLGRVVIYTDDSGDEYAATISRVDDADNGIATLHVMATHPEVDAVVIQPRVLRSYEKRNCTWRPPPRIG